VFAITAAPRSSSGTTWAGDPGRLKVYTAQTLPVAEAYRAKGILVEVDGLGEVDAVESRLKAGLGRA
jgi:adenylate kinase family enzyme